ncbi:hypothetical protein [Leptospira haakeii]|uniref:DUF4157 domain-containing protein n=1 Tax=Leptospira haakeii TaxID=2023198 RepID=A0ABX4PGX7_9LEPT|nr:hypothetical protein [Leptospira haakeii]PKA14626.1 hypothetical protein CH363_17855 [Leptospira haakeii]PKA18738.1 hypothetical protein CH377_16390 [Leptospira haakeii]
MALGAVGWLSAGVAYGLATNGKQFLNNPVAFSYGYGFAGLDYGLSSVANPFAGAPMPTIDRVPGGAIIRNSFYANNLMSKKYYAQTHGYTVSFRTGEDTYAHILHERRHIIQNRTREGFYNGYGGGIFRYFGGGKEIEADLSAGYFGYQQTGAFILFLYYNKYISDDLYRNIRLWTLLNN